MVGRAVPEALVAALDGYFDGVTRIALAHGGLVDKFVGDAVMSSSTCRSIWPTMPARRSTARWKSCAGAKPTGASQARRR